MQGVFQDYEVAPDPEDWNRIEKTLRGRKKRRILPWIIWASAACLLTLLALYTGGLLNHPNNTTIQIANKLNKINNPVAGNSNTTITALKETVNTSVSKPDKVKNEKIEENTTRNAKISETIKTHLAANQVKQLTPNVLNGKTLTNSIEQPVESLNNNLTQNNLMVHTINPRQIGSIVLSSTLRDKSKDFSYGWLKNTLDGKNHSDLMAYTAPILQFKGFSLSNNSGFILPAASKEMMSYPGAFASQMSYPGAFASQLASNMYLSSVKVFDNSFLASLNIGNVFQNNSRDYLPPITFGLNVNLSFSKDLSIETGMQYSRLQSNGTISINSSNAIQIKTSFGYKVDENLEYIGIPFIVNYNLSKNRKTSFYLSAGLSIEKGIIAKYKATPEDNFSGMSTIYSQKAIPGLQFSLNTGIGITYKFIPHFELFGQPSIGYYFKNGKTTTIYSAHPKILNLYTGIRYTIK